MHWGAQQLASTLLHASRTRRFVLGAGPGVDFDVAVPSLGRDGRIVVVAGREGFRLSAPTGFGDLGDSDASAGFQIELAHLRLSATPVRLPPRAPALLLEGVNFNHANIVLVAAMLATVLVLALAERGEAGPDFDAWDAGPAVVGGSLLTGGNLWPWIERTLREVTGDDVLAVLPDSHG